MRAPLTAVSRAAVRAVRPAGPPSAALAALGLLSAVLLPAALPVVAGPVPVPAASAAGPAAAGRTALDGDGTCAYPARTIPGTPWSLRRLLLAQMWRYGQGAGVRVAVVDTGVDDRNPQLAGAVDTRDGVDLIDPAGDGTDDTVGHGTEVAGIIAARPAAGTGFVGIAPRATVIPVRQNDDEGDGTTDTLAEGIRKAVDAGARVINISQDTAAAPDANLARAITDALRRDVVVVASAGNDGVDGHRHTTYPAAYPGVLAVGASDRSGRRAAFSDAGPFVGVVAPGVDMVSTVPLGGQCADSGTSFSAPYVAGVAVLLRGEHPGWSRQQVVARIERTAVRSGDGRDDLVGWGVVDPVRALDDDAVPSARVAGAADDAARRVRPAALTGDGGARRREEHTAVDVLLGAILALVVLVGGAAVVRDARRRAAAR